MNLSKLLKEKNIHKELIKYIESTIYPEYSKNDKGHQLDHITYVTIRSLNFASTIPDINYNMVYVIASYHDIAHHLNAKEHERISSEILASDQNLLNYFTPSEIKIMSEAVYDHRASLEYPPRSIYGQIVSSADRNTDLNSSLKRTYSYRLTNNPEMSLEEIIEDSRQHLISKFGPNGYARAKMFFPDPEYQKYLEEVTILTSNKKEFKKIFLAVNNISLN